MKQDREVWAQKSFTNDYQEIYLQLIKKLPKNSLSGWKTELARTWKHEV